MLAMVEHGGDERFMWFGLPERNTLCPRDLALGCLGFSLSILTSAATFYSTSLQWLYSDLGPDM
jgi:hypothetical protein